METEIKLKSQENLKKLDRLAKELGFESIRLMVDPQRNSSTEAVVDDICGFLELELNKSSITPVMSFGV